MIMTDNRTEIEYDLSLAERIHRMLTTKPTELILTDDEAIRALNREYRQVDKATDVLSFPLEAAPMMPLGTIVISVDRVREKASELGHSEEEELALLYLHGLLHLLGYDHECDSGEMRAKEEEIILALGLPKSLILRNG